MRYIIGPEAIYVLLQYLSACLRKASMKKITSELYLFFLPNPSNSIIFPFPAIHIHNTDHLPHHHTLSHQNGTLSPSSLSLPFPLGFKNNGLSCCPA